MHVYWLGNANLVRMGLRHGRGGADWNRSSRYGERCDSPKMAQIFSRRHGCVGPAVSSTPAICQVRMIKRSTLQLLNSSKWVRRCKLMSRLAVILLLPLPELASAKRIAPAKVDPVVSDGIRYAAPNDDGRHAYIEAWNVGTNNKLWELTIFTNAINPNLEKDVQWVFITALNIHDGRLVVTSENGKTYLVDVNTRAITQSDSLPPQSPGTICEVPKAAKKALTNGSTGKKYDLSSYIDPCYLEGDFNGDGKLDAAVLMKERSTGKLGIAIVHGTTGKVTILGAGIVVGNGGDDFQWMDSWQVSSKAHVGHLAREATLPGLRDDVLLLEKSEAASALIYWNGQRYVWYQQGD